MEQMLWLLALHPEVRVVFPFVYCDEWWHGPDPKVQDVSGDAWGIVTADRKPKSTYAPRRDTYAEFERLGEFMSTREAAVDVLVSDQAIDRWRGPSAPSVDDVCRGLYHRGVSFRLVSLLRPSDIDPSTCKRLILLDSTIPDEPDGSSPARDALAAFCAKGGEILYLCEQPWRGLYLPDGPPEDGCVRVASADGGAWDAIEPFIARRAATVEARAVEVFWRVLAGAGRDYLLLIASGSEPVGNVTIRGTEVHAVESADGAVIEVREGDVCRLRGVDTYAVLRLVSNPHSE